MVTPRANVIEAGTSAVWAPRLSRLSQVTIRSGLNGPEVDTRVDGGKTAISHQNVARPINIGRKLL